MTVADELGRRAGVDVERDEVDRRVVVQLLEAVTDRAPTDHQDPRVAVGGVRLEQPLHPRDVGRRGGVGRVQQPAQWPGEPGALHLRGSLDRTEPVRVEHAGLEVDQCRNAGHHRERLVRERARRPGAVPRAVLRPDPAAAPRADEQVLVDHRVEGEHVPKPRRAGRRSRRIRTSRRTARGPTSRTARAARGRRQRTPPPRPRAAWPGSRGAGGRRRARSRRPAVR